MYNISVGYFVLDKYIIQFLCNVSRPFLFKREMVRRVECHVVIVIRYLVFTRRCYRSRLNWCNSDSGWFRR